MMIIKLLKGLLFTAFRICIFSLVLSLIFHLVSTGNIFLDLCYGGITAVYGFYQIYCFIKFSTFCIRKSFKTLANGKS
jgi:hypothetical protein